MYHITRSFAIWVGILSLIGFNALYLVQGFIISKFVADLVVLALLTYMAAFTTPDAILSIRKGMRRANERFIVSYWLAWTLILIQRIWILTIALLQKANNNVPNTDWSQSSISGNIAIMFGIAAAYGAMAPFTGPDKIAPHGYVTMIVSVSLASIVSGIIIGIYIVGGWIYN